MKAVAEIQVIPIGSGVSVRLSTFLKIGTRTDKVPTLSGKLF